MKILHVVSSYWPAFKMGGPIQSVHLLNKYLVKKGVDVTVFTTNAGLEDNKNIKFNTEEIIDGVKVFRFPYYGYINYTFSPALFFGLKKGIKNFDAVHVHEVWNFSAFAAAFWAKFYKKSIVISPRGSLMDEPLKKGKLKKKIFLSLFVRGILKYAAAINFTTEAEKQDYLKAGLPLKKSAIIPNGIDLEGLDKFSKDAPIADLREKYEIPRDKKIVLFLGRVDWKKGLDTLIPAFAEAAKIRDDLILVVAGADSFGYRKIAEGFADSSGVKDKIIFTGTFDADREAISFFAAADIFVLPSLGENFGIAVGQAMYFGLPVIITKNVGLAPLIIENNAGVVIEKNEKELADAILKILGNPGMARKMGERGRELVKIEFSPSAVADKFLELYNNINDTRIL